jgi:hypothetical protein
MLMTLASAPNASLGITGEHEPVVLASLFYGAAAGTFAYNGLAEGLADGRFTVLPVQDRLSSNGQIIYGIRLIEQNYELEKMSGVDIAIWPGTDCVNGTGVLAGGMTQFYDGRLSNGFLLAPKIRTMASAGGSVPAGTYLYKVVFEWTDSKGNIYRSASSSPVSVTLGVASDVTVTFWHPQWAEAWRTTKGAAAGGQMYAYLYRTKTNQTTYFKCVATAVACLKDAGTYGSSSLFGTFTDSETDTDLGDNELLYSNSGVLDNAPMPPAFAMRSVLDWQPWARSPIRVCLAALGHIRMHAEHALGRQSAHSTWRTRSLRETE